jgi:hypothetical protein
MSLVIKNGFNFLDLATNVRYVGDLYYLSDMFQIRGINRTPLPKDSPIDAIIINCVLSQSYNGIELQSNVGVGLIALSGEFLQFIDKYYPTLKPYIKPEASDGQTA